MNFINILNHILRPLEWVVAQLLTLFHHALVTFGMTAGPSPAWGIAIMCLVLVIRICLLPLFLSQMRAMQRIQVLQPQIQRIQHKYAARKDPRSKEAMQREIMALQQRYNANPLGSCLPSLIQAPILCSLFYTLQSSPQSRIIIGVAVALMCLTLFAIQWMLIHRNTSKDAMVSPQFRVQKMTVFVFPAIYVVSGATLPFGVLLYWLTNNLWNLGQTLCQLRWFPTPGSAAGERKARRDYEQDNRRRAAAGLPSLEEERAMAAREEAKARREREKSAASRNRKQHKTPHLAKRSIVKR